LFGRKEIKKHSWPIQTTTDANNYQLSAVSIKNSKLVAYYSWKLNSAQHNYTTMGKELLSVLVMNKKDTAFFVALGV
jgi:hypothetical protein